MPSRAQSFGYTELVVDICIGLCAEMLVIGGAFGHWLAWLFLALLGVLYAVVTWGFWSYRRRGGTRLSHLAPLGLKRAKCSNCHYDLRSSFETCPECGQSVVRSRVPRKIKTQRKDLSATDERR